MLIGYQAVYDDSALDALRYAATTGFDDVVLDLDVPHFSVHRLSRPERSRIRAASAQGGVGIAFHAPGDNVSLFTDFAGIREAIVSRLRETAQAAEEMGARHLTVHPGLQPTFPPSGDAQDSFMRRYADYYARLLAENLEVPARSAPRLLLCVENHGMDEAAMAALDPLLRSDLPLYLTGDVAKSHGRPEVERFYREQRERIRELHLHDAQPGTRSHLALGRGTLDFSDALPLVRSEIVATTIELTPRDAPRDARPRLTTPGSEARGGDLTAPSPCAAFPRAEAG